MTRESDKPNGQWRGGRKLKYPFDTLDIGQSFVEDCPIKTISCAARQYGIRHGLVFDTKKVDAKNSVAIGRPVVLSRATA